MAGVKFVNQESKPVLLMDFSGVRDYTALPPLVDSAIELASAGGKRGSVLALVDLNGIRMNKVVVRSLQRLSRGNGPYVRAIAFVGMGWMWSAILRGLLRLRGKTNHKVLSGRIEAMAWLLGQ